MWWYLAYVCAADHIVRFNRPSPCVSDLRTRLYVHTCSLVSSPCLLLFSLLQHWKVGRVSCVSYIGRDWLCMGAPKQTARRITTDSLPNRRGMIPCTHQAVSSKSLPFCLEKLMLCDYFADVKLCFRFPFHKGVSACVGTWEFVLWTGNTPFFVHTLYHSSIYKMNKKNIHS